MVRLFIKLGHLQQNKFDQKHTNFAKEDSKFGQILDKLSETMPKWRNFAKSGHTEFRFHELQLLQEVKAGV